MLATLNYYSLHWAYVTVNRDIVRVKVWLLLASVWISIALLISLKQKLNQVAYCFPDICAVDCDTIVLIAYESSGYKKINWGM